MVKLLCEVNKSLTIAPVTRETPLSEMQDEAAVLCIVALHPHLILMGRPVSSLCLPIQGV